MTDNKENMPLSAADETPVSETPVNEINGTPASTEPVADPAAAQNAAVAEKLAKLFRRAGSARTNIMLVIVLTVLNITLLFVGTDTYFLFSASLPYYFTFFMLLYTGNMSESIIDYAANGWTEADFLPNAFLWAALIFSLIVLALYAVCFFASRSKNKLEDGSVSYSFSGGWIVTAMVLFFIDTLAYMGGMILLFGFDASMLLDLGIHILVMVELIMGAVAAFKLKRAEDAQIR